MVLGNFQCWGVLLIWINVGRGQTYGAMHSVGAGGASLDIFSLICYFSFSFSHSLGDGLIYTEILSQRAVKLKTTNQPNSELPDLYIGFYFTLFFTFSKSYTIVCPPVRKIIHVLAVDNLSYRRRNSGVSILHHSYQCTACLV